MRNETLSRRTGIAIAINIMAVCVCVRVALILLANNAIIYIFTNENIEIYAQLSTHAPTCVYVGTSIYLPRWQTLELAEHMVYYVYTRISIMMNVYPKWCFAGG